jgi:hypothetical protein
VISTRSEQLAAYLDVAEAACRAVEARAADATRERITAGFTEGIRDRVLIALALKSPPPRSAADGEEAG